MQTDSTFWSADDDRMLDIWVEHGYPESNDVVHLVDACVRLRNVARQWRGIANELVAALPGDRDSLVDAVAAYAGVSPELVQVIPNREGTPSDQTGGAS